MLAEGKKNRKPSILIRRRGLWFDSSMLHAGIRRYKPGGGKKKKEENHFNIGEGVQPFVLGKSCFRWIILQCSGQEKVPPIRQRGLLKQQ